MGCAGLRGSLQDECKVWKTSESRSFVRRSRLVDRVLVPDGYMSAGIIEVLVHAHKPEATRGKRH